MLTGLTGLTECSLEARTIENARLCPFI